MALSEILVQDSSLNVFISDLCTRFTGKESIKIQNKKYTRKITYHVDEEGEEWGEGEGKGKGEENGEEKGEG
jgi:hypothetical protein